MGLAAVTTWLTKVVFKAMAEVREIVIDALLR